MSLKKALLVFLLQFVGSFTVLAETNMHITAGIGAVSVENRDYDEGVLLDHSFGFSAVGFVLDGGFLYMDNITPSGVDDSADAEIKVKGPYIGVAKIIDFEVLQLEVGGGLMYSETVATFLGREISEDTDTSPMASIRLTKNMNDFFAVHGNWKYIDDVSGGDLHLFQAGVRFSF